MCALSVCRTGRCDAASNGFLSEGELETAAENGEGTTLQNSLQFVFPAINFTGSVSIKEWTFVANDLSVNRNTFGAAFPQLQVWRPGTLVVGSFILRSSTGSVSELRGNGPLYRYVPATPMTVMPGDVLGIYIPRVPLLLPRFKNVGEGNTSAYLLQTANSPQFFISISISNSQSSFIPLVAVEIGESVIICSIYSLQGSLHTSCLSCNRFSFIISYYGTLFNCIFDYYLTHCLPNLIKLLHVSTQGALYTSAFLPKSKFIISH